MSFHTHDGWRWKRLSDGSVAVYPPHWQPGDEHVITADGWASVVASMSAGGEVDGRFYVAQAFHASTGPVKVEPVEPAGGGGS